MSITQNSSKHNAKHHSLTSKTMANFTPNSTSYLDHYNINNNNNNDLNWDLLSPFIPTNDDSNLIQNSVMDFQSLTYFSNHHFPTISDQIEPVLSYESANLSTKNKRKADDFQECTSFTNTKKNNSRSGKKTKANEKEEKLKDVVHVRARRGQATDSHSIAERVRRGKINERLKCLQDIVPGCNNKAMGMAVMLDEIINYVQSLQNQVEFLSLKLTAASQFHDFNNEIEPLMQKTNESNGKEAQDIENTIIKRGYDEDVANLFQPIWPF